MILINGLRRDSHSLFHKLVAIFWGHPVLPQLLFENRLQYNGQCDPERRKRDTRHVTILSHNCVQKNSDATISSTVWFLICVCFVLLLFLLFIFRTTSEMLGIFLIS